MSGGKKWSAEEERYLRDVWGTMTIPGIARHLGRTVTAIKIRAQRLGLGNMLECGDYITLCQLFSALYGSKGSYSYKMKSWVKERGLPIHYQRIVRQRVRVVYLDEFWEWAEKNRSFLDFTKIEPLALGEEPEWVKEQRRQDHRGFALQRKDPWTPDEDSRLKMLLCQHRYGYAELSAILHRSAGAIQKRCTDLGLKERPVKADNHGPESQWSENDFVRLAEGIRNGESYTSIGNAIGKSEKAVRGKVYFVYFTENADKVRTMMGEGPWGSGTPAPTVKQAKHHSGYRIEIRDLTETLAGLLLYRAKAIKQDNDYDHYFQRKMCLHWDELRSVCTKGGEDCDSCCDFQKIPPQYCVRCGGTFYEREEGRLCSACRQARKKQAQRKWRRLQSIRT